MKYDRNAVLDLFRLHADDTDARVKAGIAEFSGTDGGVIVGDHMRVWKDCE